MTKDECIARVELRMLVEQYARGADLRDPALYGGAFTEDAVLDTGRSVVNGSEAIGQIAPRLARYAKTMHFIGNHDVWFDGASPDEARGEVLCQAHHLSTGDGDERVYVMNIRYFDTYRRVAGEWKIATRRLELLWDEERSTKA